MMSRVSSSCYSRRGSRSHKTDRFRKPLFDGRRHRPGPRDRGTGRATSSRGWPVRPAERRDRRRINCRRRFNRRCRAELCAAVHFYDHLAAHGCRRRVHGDPPPEGLERGRTEHQYIAAVTKHGLPAAGLPTLDNASHIVPVMIRDADRCNAASDLLLNRLPPTDQLFDRPDRNRASKRLERVKGIEPSYSAWKAAALPLSYTRNFNALSRSSVYRWHVSGSQISRIALPDRG
jgi:hypothetical protein